MFQGGVILYPFIFDSIILSFIFASLLTIIVLYKKKMSDKLLLFIKYFNIVFSVMILICSCLLITGNASNPIFKQNNYKSEGFRLLIISIPIICFIKLICKFIMNKMKIIELKKSDIIIITIKLLPFFVIFYSCQDYLVSQSAEINIQMLIFFSIMLSLLLSFILNDLLIEYNNKLLNFINIWSIVYPIYFFSLAGGIWDGHWVAIDLFFFNYNIKDSVYFIFYSLIIWIILKLIFYKLKNKT